MFYRLFAALLFLLIAAGITPHSASAAFDSVNASTSTSLEIIRITPDGEDVPAGRQIVIQFNRPVIPMIQMKGTASDVPIIITPALPCSWNWINTSALACNLPEKTPLTESTHYTVEIKPGIQAEDGATIAEAYHHSFTTARADVGDSDFRQWRSPTHPVIRLLFNQPVDKVSASQHVYFAVGDKGETRVAAKLSPDPEIAEQPQIIPVPGENYALAFKKTAPQKSDDALKQQAGREARRVWLIEPASELPPDTHVVVKTEPGIISAQGPEPSVAANDVVQLDTYPPFAFLGVKCTDNKESDLFVSANQSMAGKCNPMRPIQLSFSTPVEREKVGAMLSFDPPVKGWKQKTGDDADEADDADDDSSSASNEAATVSYLFRRTHTKGKTYDVYLPYGLKAAQTYTFTSRSQTMPFYARLWHTIKSWFTHVDPIEVTDIFGRELRSPVSAQFVTDHRTPNYVLSYTDAVLEKDVDSEIPLFVNNLHDYSFNYRSVTATAATEGQTFRKDVPSVQDVQFAVPLGVREMLNNKPGAVFGYFDTNPTVNNYHPRLFAQITPYQVHLKLGHFNTIAWVTDMKTGAPVAGATVSLYQDSFKTLHKANSPDAKAVTDAAGIAVLPGTNTLDPSLDLTRKWRDDDMRYFLRVEKGEDMALLPISSAFIIWNYIDLDGKNVFATNKELYGHVRAWGTTAQGIYRAGDTIEYKIYVRDQNNNRFVPAPKNGYNLKIIDPMGKVAQEVMNLNLSPFGGISGIYTVPKEGAVGWYRFKLSANFAKSPKPGQGSDETEDDSEDGNNDDSNGLSWTPMRVLVSDFTPSPFKVSNQLNGDLFHSDEQIEVATHAELHSGGAYTDAAARITAVLDSATFTSKHPLAKAFKFDSYLEESPTQQIFQKADKIGDKGELSLKFPTGTPNIVYGKLLVESAVADDRGKYVTGQSHADYVGVDRLVGLHSTEWLYTVGKPATVQYIVVDDRGMPAKGTAVTVTVEREVKKAARVKGAGNAYLTEYHTEWEAAGNCNGTSGDEPLNCTFTPDKAGSYRATAKIRDTKGHEHATTLNSYATGSDFVMWDNGSDSSLTIVPERTDYKVGETARYLVKNPYPGAKALITVERFGVIDRFVQTFDSSTPVVELQIKPDYLPGFYLSVVVVSPRVEQPLGEGKVDLGKPTYRMGYVAVPVKDPYKEMAVTAKTDKEVYKPRDKVTVSLHAEPRNKDKKEPVELTVVVLDESVFSLIAGGKSYFDPYAGFYKLESPDIRNYSLLTRLIGRQRFEKKGANPGGDGGADLSMRSLFKFVSYWNAELKTDKNGNATVSFEAPDNLTGWRVLAIATTPTDRFGLGEANFKVNRPTEIRPVMPNQVMEGDQFEAGFSVMNRTDKPRTLNVAIHAEGNLDAAKAPIDISKNIVLEPYKRATVLMPIQTAALPQTREDTEGKLRFTATAGDDFDQDGIVHNIPVNKRRSMDVAANYGTTLQNNIEEPIQFPKEMLPDVGGVSVVASPTVIGNVAGAFKYMRDYPYLCWEQKLSKGVMAAHYKNLKGYIPNAVTWNGSDDLPQTTLNQAASFQSSNGGMAYFVAQDQYTDPYLSAYTAIAFNWLRKSGYTVPETVEAKLHTYLSNLLKNDAVPDFYSEGMKSTVRAVALAALAERGKADLSDLERYLPHVKKMSLFGKTYFLQAALAVKNGEKYAPDVAKMILAASNETGGKFVFNETWDDGYSRILASPLRENCAVLDAFTAYGEREGGKTLVGDVPFKLVRTITQDRKNRDHWENTQENMFCMNALIDYARVYEKDKPDMAVTAAMDGEVFGQTAFKDMRDPPATMERPIKAGDPGRRSVVQIERNGTGRLYYATRVIYALPAELSQPTNAGIEIHRDYSVERDGKWVLLTAPALIKRGETVRVDLYVSVPAARNFVVVNDPVPGGLEPVNRDLATSSEVDARKGDFKAAAGAFWFKFNDWIDFGVSRWSFYHQEIRHDSVRYYSDYLPAGNYHLSYAAQAIATGTFTTQPARAEEMYDPDVYGKTEGLSLKVDEQETKP